MRSEVRVLYVEKDNLKNELNDLCAQKDNLQIWVRMKKAQLEVVMKNLEFERFSKGILKVMFTDRYHLTRYISLLCAQVKLSKDLRTLSILICRFDRSDSMRGSRDIHYIPYISMCDGLMYTCDTELELQLRWQHQACIPRPRPIELKGVRRIRADYGQS